MLVRILFAIALTCNFVLALSKPGIILPITLNNLDRIDPKQYLVSEKLDGVRAYWDGKNLLTRNGNIIHAPKWFLQSFPPFALDGELWTKRKDFEKIVSIVKTQKDRSDWKQITFHVFEVPNQSGNLTQRLKVLESYLQTHSTPYIKIIPQHQFQTLEEINHFFNQIKKEGGEGIILRDRSAPYLTGRDSSAMKFKIFFDSECLIKGYEKGGGKYKGMMGAIICEDQTLHITLRIGSGFSDAMRTNPPKIGTTITYKYYQKTKNNRPKHPVFLRIREAF